MKKIFFILMSLFIGKAHYSQSKVSTDGLLLFASAGTMSGGLGISAQYQIRIDMFTFLVPFVGTGAEFGAELNGVWLGYSLGANMEYGKQHRAFGGLVYGTKGVGYETKNSEVINVHILSGPSLIIGYKGITTAGWTWLINVGMTYMRNPVTIDKKYYQGTTAGIGIGYKF